jgi:hypothetical protein
METLSGAPGEGNAGGKVEMVFRFWGAGSRSGEPGGAGSIHPSNSSGHHPGVLALIEDAVASKRGAVVSSEEYLYISRLKRPADALVVSRQVQLGLEGFRSRNGSGPVAVSIAIDAGGERAGGERAGAEAQEPAATGQDLPHSEPPHDLVTLLKISKPAQILLTHDLCQQVTELKGLPLRSFPARFGVYEYLWTAEEKLELLQSEPQLTLAALPVAQPAKEKDGAAASAAGAAANQNAASATRTTKAFEAPLVSARTDEPEEAKSGVPRWAISGGAGLAAVIALAALGIHLAQKPAASPAASAGPVQGASAPAAQEPPAAPTIPSAQPAAAVPVSQPPAKPHTAQAKPPAAKPVAAPAPAPDVKAPAPPSAECTLGNDASRYVGLAEQARGSGDYPRAIRIFREVLACDPNNAAAREGLEKATQAQQQPQ